MIAATIPVDTKHLNIICTMLDQRRRRWAGGVQILYKYFVLAGMPLNINCCTLWCIHNFHTLSDSRNADSVYIYNDDFTSEN